MDKVQKIREEVERLHGNPYYMMAVKDVLAIIDSLQEEPVSEKKCMFTNDNYTDEDRMILCEDCKEKCEYSKKEEPASSIWHDASEEPNGDNSIVIAYDNGCTVEPSFKDFKSYSEWGTIKKSYRVKQWAYVNDVLNLTNKEESVSEDKITISKEWFEHCKKSWYNEGYIDGKYNRDRQFEETVSDDLEEAAKLHVIETRGEDVVWDENARCAMLDFKAGAQWQKEKEYTCYEEAFEDGAKWQRQKDEHLIWQTSTANYEKGIEEGKQQMMKDAVEAEVEGISKSVLNGSWGYFKVEGNYKNGEKLKIIVLKEE